MSEKIERLKDSLISQGCRVVEETDEKIEFACPSEDLKLTIRKKGEI